MADSVVQFPGVSVTTTPIAHFIRIGSNHRQIADLYAANRLRATRFVIKASRASQQKELIDTLKENNAELVLDAQTAELSAIRKFYSHARKAPWGEKCRETR